MCADTQSTEDCECSRYTGGRSTHQERQGCDLEKHTELGLGGGGGHVGEHALLLHDDLEHIGHLHNISSVESAPLLFLVVLEAAVN